MKPSEFPLWLEGKIDRFKEHAEVWWGDGKEPVALVGAPIAGSYVVEFLPVPDGQRSAHAVPVVRMNLTCELSQCTPTDPWGHIRECCKMISDNRFGGLARWSWSEGNPAKHPVIEMKTRSCDYRDLVRSFADWLQYRDACDSEERRYYENRWCAHSQAFGISFSLDGPEAVRVRAKVQVPEAYLNLIVQVARSYGQVYFQPHNFFSGTEAPPDFHSLYQRHAPRIRKADLKLGKAEERLKAVLMATCCDAVKVLYGRQKKPVTDADLKACGFDAVPCPASLQSDWD